jgi:hypothetical protein
MTQDAKKQVVRIPAGRSLRPDEPGPANFLAVIMTAATDPRCDVTKMQALLAMQREIEERDAKKAFTRDFISLQRVLPTISRDGRIEIREKNPTTGSREGGRLQQATPYATYPAIMDVCKPLMDDHGFGLASWIEPEPGGARIIVISQLDHVEHHSRQSRFPLPAETSGSKNNVQGWGSSQQYGMRYNAIALLNIVSRAPQDADKDGHGGEFKNAKGGGFAETAEERPPVSHSQRDDLIKRITAAKITEAQFVAHYGVNQIGLLPADLYDAAVKAIDEHKAKKTAR